jgi:hypothetical protein
MLQNMESKSWKKKFATYGYEDGSYKKNMIKDLDYKQRVAILIMHGDNDVEGFPDTLDAVLSYDYD